MSVFQARHYKAIAEVLSKGESYVVFNLIKMFRTDNPKFDEERFLKAIQNGNQQISK